MRARAAGIDRQPCCAGEEFDLFCLRPVFLHHVATVDVHTIRHMVVMEMRVHVMVMKMHVIRIGRIILHWILRIMLRWVWVWTIRVIRHSDTSQVFTVER